MIRFHAVARVLFGTFYAFLVILPSPNVQAVGHPLFRLKQLTDERRATEVRYNAVKGRLSPLEAERRVVEQQFRTCVIGRLQVEFEPLRKRAEKARQSLEQTRLGFNQFRQDLEAKRIEIKNGRVSLEREYTGRPRDQVYEIEIDDYITRMRNEYLQRIDQELIYFVREYINAMTNYTDIIKQYAEFCSSKKQKTRAIITGFMDNIGLIVDGFVTMAGSLAKLVQKVRSP